jgi:alcohol dehydrogenase
MTRPDVAAAVLRGPGDLRIETVAGPVLRAGQAILEVESCGVCGSDFETFRQPQVVPAVLGHEVVGRVVAVSPDAAAAWGVAQGSRVAVNEVLPCGRCRLCAGGHQELCNGFFGTAGARYGNLPLTPESGLWGGFADQMVLDPRTQLVPVGESVPLEVASLFMPVSNGINWLGPLGGLATGGTVIVVGPGPQGLAVTAVATQYPGVRVLVVGRDADAGRLALARQLGATAVSSESEDVTAAVRDVLDPAGADLVVITTSGAASVLSSATRWARVGGRIVVAGTNGWASEERFKSDALVFRSLQVTGAPGHSWASVRAAVRLLEARPEVFAPLAGPVIGLSALPGLLAAPAPPGSGAHVTVTPGVTGTPGVSGAPGSGGQHG